MLRLSALMLVAAGLSISAVGCAQCDTCDDFPAPCTGPNCAGGYGMPSGPIGPVTYSGPMPTNQPTEVLPAPGGPGAAAPPAPAVKPAVESKPSPSALPKA
jgi:hypothetical protein